MSEWKKVESSVSPEPENSPTPEKPPTTEREEPVARQLSPAEPPLPAGNTGYSPSRYSARGRRRGRSRFAAPLGLLVLVLAVVGLISLIVSGIGAIERARDDSELRAELTDFLLPVAEYNPSAFSDVNKTKQDALLLAAIWRVTEQERVRILKDEEGLATYPLDDLGRMLIPIEDIEDSYAVLFGKGAVPYHHTIGDEGRSFTVEHDKEQGVYHVPSLSSSMYVPVIDTLRKKRDTVTVRMGYVLSTKIGVDEKGKPLEASPEDAEYFQIYTVQRQEPDGWMLVSIADESPSSSSSPQEEEFLDETSEENAEQEESSAPATDPAEDVSNSSE